jgi:hypothetical protein
MRAEALDPCVRNRATHRADDWDDSSTTSFGKRLAAAR